MIHFTCAACGQEIRVDESRSGVRGRCPACHEPVVVPQPSMVARGGRAAIAKKAYGPLLSMEPKRREVEELIDMTAMVDIVFFLLIFFMVASLNAQQSSMEMPPPMPAAASGPQSVADFEADSDVLIVRIDEDDRIWLEDTEVLDPTNLAIQLRDDMERRGSSRQEATLLVLANGAAHHGTAVTVLDAGYDVGMKDLRLALNDNEE